MTRQRRMPSLRPRTPSESAAAAAARRERRRRRAAGFRRARRRVPSVAVIPTLITLGNLVAGFAAIHYAAKPLDTAGPWGWSSLTVAGALIFVGMLCDAIDGSVARLTRSTSDLGAQLDSLCDLVTFGVAPAFMMLQLASHYLAGPVTGEAAVIVGPEADVTFAKILWGVAATYVCCAGLRLARFNVETPSSAVADHMIFRGLPTPGAAGAIASLIVLHQHWLHVEIADPAEPPLALARWTALGIPLVALACAFAMVSSLPYIHVINRYAGGRRSFGYVARLVIPIVLAMWWLQETLALAFTAYALSAPIRYGPTIVRRWRRGERRGA